MGFRRLFMRRRASASDDPHDILRQGAGPASRRVRSLLSAGKRPSNALVDRAATEKEAQARQFFEAVGAVPVGRAIYSGIELWADPSIGATPVVVFATAPRAFRDTRYWLLGPGGAVLPKHQIQTGGYTPQEMHSMEVTEELETLHDVEGDALMMKWALAAGEVLEPVIVNPPGLVVHEAPDPNSPTSTIEPGTEVRITDFEGDWALMEAPDGDKLGWSRHRDSDQH